MKGPDYSPPPLDPTAVAADQTAQRDALSALQTRAAGDTSSLMARYGVLFLANKGYGGLGNQGTPPAAGTFANTAVA